MEGREACFRDRNDSRISFFGVVRATFSEQDVPTGDSCATPSGLQTLLRGKSRAQTGNFPFFVLDVPLSLPGVRWWVPTESAEHVSRGRDNIPAIAYNL